MDFSLQSGNQISLKRDDRPNPFTFMTRKVNGDIDYVNIVLMAISFAAMLVAAALYFYNLKLANDVAEKSKTLKEYQSKAETLPVNDIRVLYKKLKYVNLITKNHNVMDTAFILLGKSTENSTYYTKFAMGIDKKAGGFSLALNGVTDSYKSLVQQRNAFSLYDFPNYFSDIRISDFSLDKKTGKVNFTLNANIRFAGVSPDDEKLLFVGTGKKKEDTVTAPATP